MSDAPGTRAPAAANQSAPTGLASSFAVETAAGDRWTVGDAPATFTVRVPDRATWDRLLSASLYEAAIAFINGGFDVDGDAVEAIRWWFGRTDGHASRLRNAIARLRVEPWFQTRARARRNIQFHYDRSNDFYRQFLDSRMLYSCAYFERPSISLDDAQRAKLDHIVRKLDVTRASRFLDIGCGWGGLIIHVAEHCGARALGCTLSRRQFELATDLVRAKGLTARAMIELCDYHTVQGRFDRIASVGMYEHVGRHRLAEYFATVARLMADDGLLLNSGIARSETVRDDDATVFLDRFVFPGGEVPYLTDVVTAAESVGLEVLDVENLRHHYALTCRKWVERLRANRAACLKYVDGKTYRTWLLYLAGSVVSFERGESELYQILFAKRRDGEPHRWTRTYMYGA